MTPDMAFECLLVSRDDGVVCVMNNLLGKLSIRTNICLSSSKAFDQLAKSRPDLIVVDWENDSADFLAAMQNSGTWRKPTIVAVSETERPLPGAHVMLRKPVTAESGAKSLRVAYSIMLHDHHRRARYALMSSVKATDENSRAIDVTITDIGDGGLGLSIKQKVTVGDALSFRLLLPGTKRAIYIQARVQWTREYGAVGCEFIRIPPVDFNILHDWLRSKSRIKKPLVEL
jgi:CheY-like chemotaxis protein